MPVTCHCSSCGATYQVGEQFAGRKIKCPKCAAAILVAAWPPRPKTMAAAKPLKRAARIEADDAAAGAPAGAAAAAAGRREEPLVPGRSGDPGLSDVTPSYAAGGRSIPMLPPKRRSPARASSRGLWIGGGVLLGAAGLIAALIVTLVLVLGLQHEAHAVVAVSQPAKATEKPHKGEAPKAPCGAGQYLDL